jgi:hypothetical protein
VKVRQTLRFLADPKLVSTMLVAPEFQQAIVAALKAPECSVTASEDRVTTVFTAPTDPLLHQVAATWSRHIGQLAWVTPLDNDFRYGNLSVRTERFPATLDARVTLVHEYGITTVDYDADFFLNVPVLGEAVERALADHAAHQLALCQPLGENWLHHHGVGQPEPPPPWF